MLPQKHVSHQQSKAQVLISLHLKPFGAQQWVTDLLCCLTASCFLRSENVTVMVLICFSLVMDRHPAQGMLGSAFALCEVKVGRVIDSFLQHSTIINILHEKYSIRLKSLWFFLASLHTED